MIENRPKNKPALDMILCELGDFGRYQSIVFTAVCVAVMIHAGLNVAFVFTAMDIDYRCKIPGCDTNNTNFDTPWLENAVPFTADKPSKCLRYIQTNPNSCQIDDFDREHTETCSSFMYKSEEITIVQDYDIYCEDNLWKLTLVGTLNNIGQFIGLILTGIISDRWGRRMGLVLGMVLAGICGIIKTFATSYFWFMVFEFFEALFGSGTYTCGFVIGVELVSPNKRILAGTFVGISFALGEVLLAVIAWLVKSWKVLIYIVDIPCLLFIFYFWIIPESIRWNLTKGRIDVAKKTLKRAAQINKINVKDDTFDKLNEIETEEMRSKKLFKEVFKSLRLFLRFINCCISWITCAFLFYGLSLNSVSLAGDSYFDFILTSLAEIPAYIVYYLFGNRIGRRKSLCGLMFMAGASCLIFLFLPREYHYAGLLFYLLGKAAVTAAFIVAYLITSELFPTGLRHSMMGACSTIGRIGSMIAPQTPLLAQIWSPLPLIVYAATAIITGLLALLFPETLNVPLPNTIEEAINIGKIS